MQFLQKIRFFDLGTR